MISGLGCEPDHLPVGRDAQRRADASLDICSGPLQVRLAQSDADIDAAQALRYRVFFESLGARPQREAAWRRRDFDRFDKACDHLLVL
ncbi:MAG: GNAT family N-acyltransferase, partial [Stellaceae bacterium]